MKKLIPILLVLALLLTFAACGPTEPEQTTAPPTVTPTVTPTTDPTTAPTTEPTEPPVTAQSLVETLSQLPPFTFYQMDMVMDMTIDLGSLGMSMEFVMTASGDQSLDPEQGTAYSETAMHLSAMGQKQEQLVRSYTFTEGDKRVTFAYDSVLDTWIKGEEENTGESLFEGMDFENAVLREAQEEYDGVLCYVLDVPTDTNAVMTGMGDTNDLLTSGSDELPIDLSVLTAHSVVYIRADNGLPWACVATVEGVDAIYNQLFAASFQETGLDVEVTTLVNDFSLTISHFSVDPVEVTTLTEEQLAEALLKTHEPLQEDGSYLLRAENAEASLRLPADWTVRSSAYNQLVVSKGECLGNIQLCEGKEGELQPDLLQQIVGSGLTIEEGKGKKLSGYQTYYSQVPDMGVYLNYVFVPVTEDTGLLIYTYTVGDELPLDALKELLQVALPNA